MPSPQWTTLLDLEAVGLKGMDLLLRHQSHGLLLGDLLSVDAERRNWIIAARDFLKRGEFVAAARCTQQTTDAALVEEIETAYQSRRKQYQQNVEELYRQARDIERVAKELQELTLARGFLEMATESLEKLPLLRPGVVVQLATLSNQALSDFDVACAEAEMLLQKAQQEALSRQEKQKGEIRQLSKQIHQLIDELLLDEIQTGVVQRLGERARNALMRRDIDELRQVQTLLNRVQSGQSLRDDEVGDALGSDSGLAPVSRMLGGSLAGSIVEKATAENTNSRPRLADLSMLVQQDLERAQNQGSALSELPPIEPLDFERRVLEQQYAQVKPLAANQDTKAMSQYLLC